jgi:thiamine-monophosphate kinase
MVSKFGSNDSVLLPSGDDAAIVAMPDGDVVVSTDMAVEGVHFRTDWSSPTHIGAKIAAQNVADIMAMGAYPTAMTVALAVPPATHVTWLEALAVGIEAVCKRHGVAVVGGDMSSSPNIVVSITVLGQRRGVRAVTRAGAQPGNIVAIAGALGHSAAGLACLLQGHHSPRNFVDAFLCPLPPVELGPVAAKAGATAMIDVSDGLISDLSHIAKASGIDIHLDPAALLPPPEMADLARALGASAREWVLTGGEDHALVAVFPAETPLPAGFRLIGKVSAPSTSPKVLYGTQPYAGKGGHDHFAPRATGGN